MNKLLSLLDYATQRLKEGSTQIALSTIAVALGASAAGVSHVMSIATAVAGLVGIALHPDKSGE